MVREPARFAGIASIKELDHGARRVHSSGSVDAWAKPEPQIVCCHALAVSATGYVDQRTQTWIGDARQVLQTDGDDGAVFSGQFCDVSDCSNRNNLHERGHLRLAAVLSEQRVHEFESDSDSGEILVRIRAAGLV